MIRANFKFLLPETKLKDLKTSQKGKKKFLLIFHLLISQRKFENCYPIPLPSSRIPARNFILFASGRNLSGGEAGVRLRKLGPDPLRHAS